MHAQIVEAWKDNEGEQPPDAREAFKRIAGVDETRNIDKCWKTINKKGHGNVCASHNNSTIFAIRRTVFSRRKSNKKGGRIMCPPSFAA
jgi:hypothetical protein